MDQNQIFKQMIDFNKAAFDNSFSAMVMVQEQMEKVVGTILDQAKWLPEDGKKAIKDWADACKKGSQDFKKTADENYKKVEDFFASAKK